MSERRPSLIGICRVWIRNVRLLGSLNNKYIAPGTVGDMEVQETSVGGRVINACFHPGGQGHGYGLVVWPEWEYVVG
jgi:hypothetical protein